MRCFLELAFCGAPYHGWQRQPGASSVQQTIEEAFGILLGQPTPIVGAGRTDAGVNARLMVAHVDLPDSMDEEARKQLLYRADAIVGPSISLRKLRVVPDNAHARFDATERTYRYFIHHQRSPFISANSVFIHRPLDYESMNDAAALLLDTEDFTSFARLHSDAKTNICHVTHAQWTHHIGLRGDEEWVFEIKADRFLRNMVRAVVGTLVEVGRGALTLDQFQAVINAKDRCRAGMSMPAHGLYLWDVKYPY